jgi:hypothetical protein
MRFILALAIASSTVAAQTPGTPDSAVAAFARATRAARARLASDAGALWGARLDTLQWLGVSDQTMYATSDPHAAGFVARPDGLWSGPLPAGMSPANTSTDFAGRRWAMVLLRVSRDSLGAERLLIHEAMHVVQPSVLPRPAYSEGGPDAALLDEPDGRVWLKLEWSALARALEASGDARVGAARDALTFRARRYVAATTTERLRERVLDVTEGLPEYTGWALTGATPADFARNVRARAAASQSYVRSFPYYTGPAYALLLDAQAGSTWRRLTSDANLQLALATAVAPRARGVWELVSGDSYRASDVRRAAETAGARYGLDSVRAAETTRWAERQKQIAALRAQFVNGPLIRIRAQGASVAFDPYRQTSLGTDGTVMGGFLWRNDDGVELSAPAGALVSSAWQEFRIPRDTVSIPTGPVQEKRTWTSAGWSLTLVPGWVVTEDAQGILIKRAER